VAGHVRLLGVGHADPLHVVPDKDAVHERLAHRLHLALQRMKPGRQLPLQRAERWISIADKFSHFLLARPTCTASQLA
jgi:hypothetical protein